MHSIMDNFALSQIPREKVDWREPIVWNDGSPTYVMSYRHGQVTVHVDKDNWPLGVNNDGSLRRILTFKPHDGPAQQETYFATNVMCTSGRCLNGAVSFTAHIINEIDFKRAQAMALNTW